MVETKGSGESAIPIVKAEAGEKKAGVALAASPQVFFIRGTGNGVHDFQTTINGVNKLSYIVASITEINPSTNTPLLGNARMTVNNVVPFDGGIVKVRVTIDWPNPLTFWINGFWQ